MFKGIILLLNNKSQIKWKSYLALSKYIFMARLGQFRGDTLENLKKENAIIPYLEL